LIICIFDTSGLDGLLSSLHMEGGNPHDQPGPSNTGGGNPGGAPNPSNNKLLPYNPDSGLPRESSNKSLTSDVSYTSDDLEKAHKHELTNVKLVMDSNHISNEEKKVQISEMFNTQGKELIKAKNKIKELKKTGKINIGLDIE